MDKIKKIQEEEPGICIFKVLSKNSAKRCKASTAQLVTLDRTGVRFKANRNGARSDTEPGSPQSENVSS